MIALDRVQIVPCGRQAGRRGGRGRVPLAAVPPVSRADLVEEPDLVAVAGVRAIVLVGEDGVAALVSAFLLVKPGASAGQDVP